mgnify:FL=1
MNFDIDGKRKEVIKLLKNKGVSDNAVMGVCLMLQTYEKLIAMASFLYNHEELTQSQILSFALLIKDRPE